MLASTIAMRLANAYLVRKHGFSVSVLGVVAFIASAAGCSSAVPQRAAGAFDAGPNPPRDAGAAGDAAAFADAPSALATCPQYCDQVLANCSRAFSQYENRQQCLDLCATFAHRPGNPRIGNSLECRLYHADDPARTAPARYCPAAGLLGAEVCGGRCESFCVTATAVCAGASAFNDYASCMQACVDTPGFSLEKARPDAVFEALPADTLNCRARLLGKALDAPERYCAELGIKSYECR